MRETMWRRTPELRVFWREVLTKRTLDKLGYQSQEIADCHHSIASRWVWSAVAAKLRIDIEMESIITLKLKIKKKCRSRVNIRKIKKKMDMKQPSFNH
jgi:predicted transcriptional regulator